MRTGLRYHLRSCQSWHHRSSDGSTSGRSTWTSTNLQMDAQGAHVCCTEACRARIVGLMMDDKQGRRRVEEHKRKREEPTKKTEGEKDLPAQEAMGEPAVGAAGAGAGHVPGQVMEYEEDPVKRAELKRAAAEPSASSSPKSKAKPTTQVKRPGALHIAPGPKLKMQPKQGERSGSRKYSWKNLGPRPKRQLLPMFQPLRTSPQTWEDLN